MDLFWGVGFEEGILRAESGGVNGKPAATYHITGV